MYYKILQKELPRWVSILILQVIVYNFFMSRAWIAQSVEHQTFNLRVQGSSPCSGGIEIMLTGLGQLKLTHKFWVVCLARQTHFHCERKKEDMGTFGWQICDWQLWLSRTKWQQSHGIYKRTPLTAPRCCRPIHGNNKPWMESATECVCLFASVLCAVDR